MEHSDLMDHKTEIMARIDGVFQKENNKFFMNLDAYTKKVVTCTADIKFDIQIDVLTQLKKNRPWRLTIHCANHIVELAVKEAFNIPEFKPADEF